MFLEELKGVLEGALHLLSSQHSSQTLPSNSNPFRSPQSLHQKSSKPFQKVHKWKWALRDKERVQKIVTEFSDLNRRIEGHVKLYCFATTFGVDSCHLKHLSDDSSSKELGFDVDAKLQLLVRDAVEPQEPFEIRDSSLYDCARSPLIQIEDRFSVCVWNGANVLLEYRSYAPIDLGPVPPNERKRSVTEKLAALLHQPKELSFRTLSCAGWYIEYMMNRVVVVYSLPEDVDMKPLTLLQTLQQRIQPSLGDGSGWRTL